MTEVPISYLTLINLRTGARDRLMEQLLERSLTQYVSNDEILQLSDQIVLGLIEDLAAIGLRLQIREPNREPPGKPVKDPAQRAQFVTGAVDDSGYREGRRRR